MRVVSTALLVTIAACSRNPGPSATTPQPMPATPAAAAPAPTPAPVPAAALMPVASAIDMTGHWVATIEFNGQSIGLDVTLTRAAGGQYSGSAAPEGAASPAPLSSLRLDGNHAVMVFAAPDGEATFDVMLSGDRRAFTGNISYQGQQIPIAARKRP